MRLLRVGPAGAERPAVLIDGAVRDVSGHITDYDATFFADGGLDRLRTIVTNSADSLPAVDAGARIGSPVRRPGKVVCIGLNYADHAAESGAPLPTEPVVFMKDPSTVVGPNDDVRIPRTSEKTDWEVELGVVIGATARYLDRVEDAAAVIAGYCVSHDVSERHFQLERGGQWDKGKSCETFNPLGPWLATADEVADPQQLDLWLKVNGEDRQNGTTSNMVFPVLEIVRYLSQFMVLEPGDVVNTGTPAGVAMGMKPPAYLRAGDVVELGVEGLGAQRQTFVPAP
jgi:2-keto-4-pentenoate hydratase/2-oxohepta-3-ene-1,7-dioic acid hydratase in catechol pathway